MANAYSLMTSWKMDLKRRDPTPKGAVRIMRSVTPSFPSFERCISSVMAMIASDITWEMRSVPIILRRRRSCQATEEENQQGENMALNGSKRPDGGFVNKTMGVVESLKHELSPKLMGS